MYTAASHVSSAGNFRALHALGMKAGAAIHVNSTVSVTGP